MSRLLNARTNEAETETVPPPTGRDTDGDGIVLPLTPYTPTPPLALPLSLTGLSYQLFGSFEFLKLRRVNRRDCCCCFCFSVCFRCIESSIQIYTYLYSMHISLSLWVCVYCVLTRLRFDSQRRLLRAAVNGSLTFRYFLALALDGCRVGFS